MKYVNIAINDSRMMIMLRSIFSVEELRKFGLAIYNITLNANYLVILNKSIFLGLADRNQVTIGDSLSNNLYFIYYESELSKKLIRTCITGDKQDFFRAIISHTSSEFKRMIYELLGSSARTWLMGNHLHIYVHCDNYRFSDNDITFEVFTTRSEFHGEVRHGLRPEVKFNIKDESVEDIAKKINEVFKSNKKTD